MDNIVPPSTTYAAFNWYGDRAGADTMGKAMEVYPFNGHEGGDWRQVEKQREFLDRVL
jgi:cephalosporin-C deacetylase